VEVSGTVFMAVTPITWLSKLSSIP